MSAPEPAGDELDMRIRALEAERMRPVPLTPTAAANAEAARRAASYERADLVSDRRAKSIDDFLEELRRDFESIHTPPNSSTPASTRARAQTGTSSTGKPRRARKSRTSDPQAKTRTIDVSETPSGGE